jgi:peptidoglycan glycosyltransferase
MAMVAATIGNGGVVMSPYVVDRVLAHDHHVVFKTQPNELGRAVKAQTATQVTQMMVDAVNSGTGTNARISGIPVAGKTGTAETGIAHTNTTWFISFAPADHPRVAIAVVLEKQHGFGGSIAAPIAKQVMEVLLHGSPGP